MNQTANMTAGPQGIPGPIDDNVAFINGTRAFTGNLSMASHYIVNLLSPSISTDAANKGYVDSVNTSMKNYIDAVNVSGGGEYDQYFLINGTRAMTGATIKRDSNNAILQLMGGADATGGAAVINVRGADYGAAPGSINFYVPNAAKNALVNVFNLVGNTNTPTMDALTNRIINVGAVTTNGDALSYDDWTAWTPTLAWTTATPASVTTIAQYYISGKSVHFIFETYSSDSNGCTGLTATLPTSAATISNMNTAFSGWERYGAAGTTYTNPLPYVRMDANQDKIQFYGFQTATDGQTIVIGVSGEYKIA
jgi:hypothetical protein